MVGRNVSFAMRRLCEVAIVAYTYGMVSAITIVYGFAWVIPISLAVAIGGVALTRHRAAKREREAMRCVMCGADGYLTMNDSWLCEQHIDEGMEMVVRAEIVAETDVTDDDVIDGMVANAMAAMRQMGQQMHRGEQP